MSNATLRGICPDPFYQENMFPADGGFISGRFCFTESLLNGTYCCLPCPQTDWLYPDNFNTITAAANWVSVAATVCALFLLVSFAFLPVDKTHRHYLSVCLIIGVIFMELGFVVPLGAQPDQCFNEITPNDMTTSTACAVSGAFLLVGGWSGVMWVFVRALSLHLQICWQVIVGKNFMIGAMAAGWGIPAIGLTVAMAFSGVSFRFGDTCHINHTNSLADFWIPLLAFSGMTVIIQFATFGYCIKVYLASLADNSATTNSSGLPSYTGSLRTVSPRQAYRRVRRVIELQWRGIVIVLLIAADVIFFAVVFVYLDNTETTVASSPTKAEPWLLCLYESGGDKNSCLNLASSLTLNEATTMAVLILLAMNGIWLLILLGRKSMFTGWYDLIKGRIRPNREFVSVDARTYGSKDPRSYEMLTSSGKDMVTKTPDLTVLSPVSPVARSGRETPDYFGREARYVSPSRSFSAPRAPTQSLHWDSQLSYAPSQRSQRTYDPNHHMNPLGMNKI